jgi:hypothetical protein
MPDAYAFEVYDAETGDFLFAIAKSTCNARTPEERYGLAGGYAGASFEAGTTFSLEERAKWREAWQEMDEGPCQAARVDPDSALRWVRSVAGHTPGLPDGVSVQREPPRLLIPAADAGANRTLEHAVRVEGGLFDVRVWSGVGQRDGFCPSQPDGGPWQIAHSLNDDRSNDFSDRYFMLCVSFRYVGELPASPA